MQNEYPPKAHRKIVTLPPSPILTRLEIQMYKFTKRIVPVLTIESASRHRFTHELKTQKIAILQNECWGRHERE